MAPIASDTPPAASSHRPRAPDPERPSPIDLADRMILFQRRTASATKPRDRSDRPTPSKRPAPSPSSSAPRPISPDADPNAEDFSRRLRLSPDPRSSPPQPPPPPTPAKHHGKFLVVPEGTLPIRRTVEPEPLAQSSTDRSSRERGLTSRTSRGDLSTSNHRQLFDYRKDDPVRFQSSSGSRPVPTSKSSGDTFVSASSTSNSSYAHSIGSSFTLTSNSTGTSGSSLSGFQAPRGEGEGNNAFVVQLKRLYREITSLESKLTSEDLDAVQEDERPFALQARNRVAEFVPEDKFVKVINEHKRLADMMQKLMTMTLSPQVPTSVHTISTKYNIPTRLWGNAFHRVLESLRRASTTSPVALEHLTDTIFWAYSFYTALVEDPQVESFRGHWLEALGELARYRMAVATYNPASVSFGPSDPLPPILPRQPNENEINSPSPSIGAHAAQALEVEPEREQWRNTARRWYALYLTETPGTGRLHHHLGLLSRDAENEEMRAVFHFAKSLTVLHPFPTSRESVLPLFSVELQIRRASPEASLKDLYLLLHGMLFTHIQLDNFGPSLDRFLECLSLDFSGDSKESRQLEERDWIMIGVLNICALLEYGKGEALLRGSGVASAHARAIDKGETTKALVIKKADASDKEMDVDDDGEEDDRPLDEMVMSSKSIQELEAPWTFRLACQFTFGILKYTLRHPYRTPTPFSHPTLNPYISILLTYICTAVRIPGNLAIVEREIPWHDLATFLNTAPPRVKRDFEMEIGLRLTQGCTPLSEDWCIRGMEWVGRRTYERGFWKADTGHGGEQAVLDLEEVGENVTDGIIEDDDDDESTPRKQAIGETVKRWIRIQRASAALARQVDGFDWDKDTRSWKIHGLLSEKIEQWNTEQLQQAAAEEARRQRRRIHDPNSDPDMDIDDEQSQEEEGSDSDEPEEIRELKKRRNFLRDLVQSDDRSDSHAIRRRSKPKRSPDKLLKIVAGYTILVFDTNILLTSLASFISLIESHRWTVVVPLAVVTELDGLSSNTSELGTAATAALSYISSQIRKHAVSLKVQTSKGNYLSTLSIRNEDVHFSLEESNWERNMDDLILRAAIWQDEHWVDRSRLLTGDDISIIDGKACKVALLTFDRNLRLKARARQLDAADQKLVISILSQS